MHQKHKILILSGSILFRLKLSSRNIWGDYLLKLDDGILLQKEDDDVKRR